MIHCVTVPLYLMLPDAVPVSGNISISNLLVVSPENGSVAVIEAVPLVRESTECKPITDPICTPKESTSIFNAFAGLEFVGAFNGANHGRTWVVCVLSVGPRYEFV